MFPLSLFLWTYVGWFTNQLAPALDADLRADPLIQRQLAILVDAADGLEKQRFIQEVEKLRRLAEKQDRKKILLQAVLHGARGTDVGPAMAKYLVIKHLEIPYEDVLDTLIPHLGRGDADIDKHIVKLLQRAEMWHEDPPVPDFSCYERFIAPAKDKGQAPPHGLVDHMYRSCAERAFLLMLRVYKQDLDYEEVKKLLWAEHVISEMFWKRHHGFLEPQQVDAAATGLLEYLVGRPEWWARLYVAEIVRENRELLTKAIRQALERDKHPLIQKRWQSVK